MEVTMSKKPKKHDCVCSGHPRGRPKVTKGPCYGWGVRRAVQERVRGKRLARSWMEVLILDDADI